MTGWSARAPGKVNLCLFLGERREDGLHELVSVVEPVSLADEVVLELTPEAAADEVVCPGVEGPNLAAAALAELRRASGWAGGPVRVSIVKRIPVAGGMGGGSADAAATLRLAGTATAEADTRSGPAGRGVSEAALSALAEAFAPALGADVPAALAARPALVEGAGERVSVVRDLFPHALAIVPVAAALATPDVYREADRQGLARPAAQLADRREQVLAWLAAGGSPPPELLVNDLEPAARALCPLIDRALDDLRSAGAEHVLVSGSGPTVFGVFAGADGERAAEAAVAALRGHHPHASAALPVGPDYAHPRPLAATR